MFPKTTFGQTATPSFGGFNAPGTTAQTGASTAFSQNAFSKPATGSAFPAPTFGGASSTMFGGGSATTNTGLFGSTTTPAFGQPPQQSATGFTGFNTGASAPLFGSNTGVSSFAQPKPTFGGFGASTSTPSLFGTQSTASGTTAGQPGTSLFNQTPSLFGSGFVGAGTAGSSTLGTPIKFNPVTGTDSMAKNGLTQNINTRHQCITCMKEYENKSLEELRTEDLQAGRKGPTGGEGIFGSTGQSAQTSLFGSSGLAQPGPSGTGFGENKTLFGSTVPTSTGLGGFGTTATGFGTTSGGLFGKSAGFGATTTTTASGFSFNNNTTTSNPFGAVVQNKPFGAAATTTGSLFGAQPNTGNVFGTQNTTGFGAFGAPQQQQQQGIGLFGQNKQATFGMSQPQPTASTAFNFGQQTNTNATQGGSLFGGPKPQLGATIGTSFGSTSLFGAKPTATAAPAFGSIPFGAPSSTSLGGTTNTLFGQSTFGKPGGPTTSFGFNQTNTGTTAPNQGLGGGTMFGSSLGKPSAPGNLFGTSGGSVFGNTNTSTTGMNFGLGTSNTFGNQTSAAGGLGLGPAPGLNFNAIKTPCFSGIGGQSILGQQSAPCVQDPHQRMSALLANPFERPIFNGLPTDKLKELMSSTNPSVLKAIQSQSPSYNISTGTTKPRLPVSPKTLTPSKKSLFEGLESTPSNLLLGNSAYVTPSFEHKRLNLRATPTDSSSSTILNNSTTTTTSPTGSRVISNIAASTSATEPDDETQYMDRATSRPPIAAWLTSNNTPTSGSSKTVEETPTNQQKEASQEYEKERNEITVRRLALDEMQSPLNDSNISASPLELSEIPEEEESLQSLQPPHPANIKLQRAGYFTIPSLQELAERTDENGHCLVDSFFTIGRENYGNICFEGPIDVSNLNLDELVHIRHREVTVYPSDAHKHPEGQGLNRRATVTLDRVYPVNKQTREPITNIEAIREMDYESLLRRKCTKMGSRFVEYRPDTGSFVFKVQHFSKYEVNEDSDSEEIQPQDMNKKACTEPKQLLSSTLQQQQQLSSTQTPLTTISHTQLLTNNSVNTHYTLQGAASEMDSIDENMSEAQLQSDELAVYSNTDLCKLRVMKVSFFTETVNDEQPQDFEKSVHQEIQHDITTTVIKTQTPNLNHIDRFKIPGEERVEQTEKKLLRPCQHPSMVTPSFQMLPARISLQFDTSCADSSLFMTRKFSATWGPSGTLLDAQGTSIDQLTPYATTNVFKEWVDRHLGVQLRHTGLVAEMSKVSRRCIQTGLTPLEEHCKVLNSVADHSTHEIFIRQVLQLCLALWGPLPGLEDDPRPSVVEHKRKEALGEWLRDVIETQSDEGDDDISEDASLNLVLQHLNKGQLLDSVRTSQDMGEHYGALVLATAGSSNTCRQLVQRQLQEWVSDGVSSLVNPLRLRCWLMAGAGLPLLPLEQSDTLSALQGLDWITCLAIYFWYLCSPGASISDILTRYEEAFSGEDSYAAAPIPPGGCVENFDMRFHLLKLFSRRTYSLEPMLKIESHFPDNLLDNSLSWLLLVLLDSLHYTHVEGYSSQSIHLAFSEQLEAAGLWHWAVFVLQHITHPTMRDSAIEQMISRHVTISSARLSTCDELSPAEEFVVSQLDVPATMIFQAKAQHAACNNMYPETACFQLHAKDWSGCHYTVVHHLAADGIITRNSSLVMTLLRALRPHAEVIEGWKDQGQVILHYLLLMEDVRGLQLAGVEDGIGLSAPSNLEALRQRIKATATKLSGLPSATPKDLLCQCEMSKCLLALQNSVKESEDKTGNKSWRDTFGSMVATLPLPDDYRLEELQYAAKLTLLNL